jgi:tRNA (guanine-N7-)-methyltransferase
MPKPPENHGNHAAPPPCEFVPPDYFRRLERREIFPDEAPLEIDLGCGDGSFLVDLARALPGHRFLGVERLLGRVRKVCRKAKKAGLDNLRVLRLESRYTVEWLLPPASVHRLHLLCPDPWPKARHHRRRLVQPEFLAALAQVLEPGGEFLFKTDDAEYFEWTRDLLADHPGLEPLPWPDDAFFYPQTDFERQWLAAGRTIRRLRCRRAAR